MAYISVNGKLVKADKNKPNIIRGEDFKLPNAGFVGSAVLDLMTEFHKAIKIVVSDPLPYDTKSTPADYEAMGFSEAGFLMALIPYNGQGIVAKKDADIVAQMLSELQTTRISKHWVLASTYITRDIAYDKFCRIHNTFHTAFIAYSTTKNISTLSEDCDLVKALRDNKNPVEVLSIMP